MRIFYFFLLNCQKNNFTRDKIGTGCGVDMNLLAERMRDAKVVQKEKERKKRLESKKRKKNKNVGRRYTIDDFDLVKILGAGGFGKVFLAKQKGSEKFVAIKSVQKPIIVSYEDYEITLTERLVLSFGSECMFLTNLVCSFQTKERLFFVMEYLSGGDLLFHLYKVNSKESDPTKNKGTHDE